MLCAIYSRPQEESQYSILWFNQTEKEQLQPMATKKGAKKSGGSKGGSKGAAKKSGGSKGGAKKGAKGGKKR
jgi:hypothetical protein